MAGGHETSGAASSSGSCYTTVDAARELRGQRSMSAAAFGNGGFGEFRGQCAPRGSGGVGAVARALWAWVARGRRKVLRRSGSSEAKEQYGHEEYAQNFDEGAAAAEPENLSRSFSARYARRRLAR